MTEAGASKSGPEPVADELTNLGHLRSQPYATVAKHDLVVRDLLALDRTILANERTLLSYARTALAPLAGGITAIHFADVGWLRLLGWIVLPMGPAFLGLGVWRFLTVRQDLNRLRKCLRLIRN